MNRDVTALAVLPFAHLFGLVVSGVAPMLGGGRVITMERFNPARVVELLEEGGISDLVAVPSVFATIVALAERRGTTLGASGLRLCICGGAPLAVELQDRWFELTGLELRQGYGSPKRDRCASSTGSTCLTTVARSAFRFLASTSRSVPSGRTPKSPLASPARSGSPALTCSPATSMRADFGQRRKNRGRPGCIATARGSARAVRSADGTASFHGVIKPMFTRNGFNIYPREIERVVEEMEGVQRVTSRPIPEPIRENDIAIDVRGDVDAADVKRWCDERLSVYKRPTSIVITPGT